MGVLSQNKGSFTQCARANQHTESRCLYVFWFHGSGC